MRALITGITGFAGSFLAEHLLDQQDEVLGASRRAHWPAGPPAARLGRVPLVAWDLAAVPVDPRPVRRAIADFAPECIYHLAALSVPDDCGLGVPTPAAWAANVEGTARVLALAAQLPRPPRVLVVSSSHVYAPLASAGAAVAESAPLGPRRGYGITKLAAEEAALRAAAEGLEVVVARAFQHTGPRQVPRMMLPQWCAQFADESGRPVEVFTRNAVIDLCDVRDVVRAYRLLICRGRSGEIYNIGSGRPQSSGEVLELLRKLANPKRPVVELRPGAVHDPIADIGHLVAATGWQPQIAVAQTVSDTWDYWRLRAGGATPAGRAAEPT